jgi:hypothetical protein
MITPGNVGESGLNVDGRDREAGMALFMEVHTINGGVSMGDVASAHAADLAIQGGGHGVRYLRYWVDEQDGKVFCLVEAPSGEAAASVHRQAHGLVADKLYQVKEGL